MSASTPEGKVKAKIKAYLKSLGVWSCTPVGSMYMSAGVPDILCCWQGYFVGIEVKAPGNEGRTTALQDFQLDAIQKAGGIAIVASAVADVEAIFKFIESRYAHETIPEKLQSRGGRRERKAKAGPTRPDEGPLRLREEARSAPD